MKSKTVVKTSVFAAPIKTIFGKLKELKTLQYVAAPYAAFSPIDGNENLVWEEGKTFSFRFRLFGFMPFGIHTIKVVEFSEEAYGIFTNESNTHVPVWNHRILLKQIENAVRYTDEVEIYAGWKTPLVYLWAKSFYAHRQRKWQKMLKEK